MLTHVVPICELEKIEASLINSHHPYFLAEKDSNGNPFVTIFYNGNANAKDDEKSTISKNGDFWVGEIEGKKFELSFDGLIWLLESLKSIKYCKVIPEIIKDEHIHDMDMKIFFATY